MSNNTKRLARLALLESKAYLDLPIPVEKKKKGSAMFVGVQDTELFNKHFEDAAAPEAATPDGGSTVDGGEAVSEGGLMEDTIRVSKLNQELELPEEIRLLDKAKIEEAIDKLEPEEMFEVGYVTPLYFYKELWDVMPIYKCTEMSGYTGVDFSTSEDSVNNDKGERIARAMQEIDTAKRAGSTSNVGSDAYYSMQNKLRDMGKIRGNTILFYPVGKPKTCYFVRLPGKTAFIKVNTHQLEQYIYTNLDRVADKIRTDITKARTKVYHTLYWQDAKSIDRETQAGQAFATRYILKYGRSKLQVRALYTNQLYFLDTEDETMGYRMGCFNESLEENMLAEEKRYVRRYYIRPQNIFCSNKGEILKALIDMDDENCTIYTLNNLGDEKDVTKLTNDDIIYYYDDEILYDKNHVKVMDYDLYIKHEEERDSINPDQVSDKTFGDVYNDRMTDLTVVEDAEEVANKEGVKLTEIYPDKLANFVKRAKSDFAGLVNEAQDKLDNSKTKADDFAILSVFMSKLLDVAYEKWSDASVLFSDSDSWSSMPESVIKQFCTSLFTINNLNLLYELPVWEGLPYIQEFIDEPTEAEYASFYNDCVDYFNDNFAEDTSDEDAEDAFDLEYESVDCQGTPIREAREKSTCCICGEELEGYGNNAEPYKPGKCCDACNLKFVIPARLEQSDKE